MAFCDKIQLLLYPDEDIVREVHDYICSNMIVCLTLGFAVLSVQWHDFIALDFKYFPCVMPLLTRFEISKSRSR